MPEEILDKKGVIKAIIIAALVALVGIIILGWQYHKIEQKIAVTNKEQETIKEEQEAIKNMVEGGIARDRLRDFMSARIEQNKEVASFYLTERAENQLTLGEFSLIDSFGSYEIVNSEKLSDNQYRFIVKTHHQDIPVELTEIITLIKISEPEGYYIDSVQIAG